MFKNYAISPPSRQESVSQQNEKLQYDHWLKKYPAADRDNRNDHVTQYRVDYSTYLSGEKTRLFPVFGKRKLEQGYQALAQKIVLAALAPDKKISADAGAEIVYLLLHLVHQQAFKQLGVAQRDTVLAEVSRIAVTGYASAVLDVTAPADACMRDARQMTSTLKSRRSVYSQCASLFGESFPGNGTMVFALSFFVYKAMGHTDRNDVDDILTGKRDIGDSELEDFPKPPEIMAAARAVESIVDELQIPHDLTRAKSTRKPALSRSMSMFFGWVAAGAAIVVLVWWAKSAGKTGDIRIGVPESDETMQTSKAPGLRSHPNESVERLTGLITHPESSEVNTREITASVTDAEHKSASSTSPSQPVITMATDGIEPLLLPVGAGHADGEAHAATTLDADGVAGGQSGSRNPNTATAGTAAVMEHRDPAGSERPAVGVDNMGPWVINLVSSPSKADADRLEEKARSSDIQTQQQQVTVKGKQYWRVQISGFSTAGEARTYADTAMERLGLKDVWIMKR